MDFLEGQGKEGPFTVTKFEKYSKRLEVIEMVEKCTDGNRKILIFARNIKWDFFGYFQRLWGYSLTFLRGYYLGSEAENALAFLVVLLQTESNIFCLFHTWLHY